MTSQLIFVLVNKVTDSTIALSCVIAICLYQCGFVTRSNTHCELQRKHADTPRKGAGVQTMAEDIEGLEADFKYLDILTWSAPENQDVLLH